jgi:hypothetical protein
MLFGTEDDAKIEEMLGVSRADHENRNQFNELPNGKLNPSPEDETIWKDDDGRPWKLNAEQLAAYHQETWFVFAYITAQIGRVIPSVKVPNLKFFSPNADGKFSEVIANRYTGELLIDQRYIGTYNFCLLEDAPNAMKDGKLPFAEHKRLDVDTHNSYGGNYRHLAINMPIDSVKKGPVILGTVESKSSSYWM